MKRIRFSRLGLFLASITPGLFLIGYNIGTGSITTMASAGAAHGMMLTWPLLISCIFTFILVMAFGRYTAITGRTILHTFKTEAGKGTAIVILVSLLVSEWVSCMGVMGVVTQVVQEWSRPLTKSGEGFNTIYLAIMFGIVLYAMFLNGRHKFFEKVLALFVGIMGLSFLLTMFMVIPEPSAVFTGLVPKVPKESDTLLLMAGMVGTTMGAILYVVRSILVQEKGWGLKDLKNERRDAIISVSLMFLLSAAVMASAAGTLFPRGLKVDNAIDMVSLLEPLAGRFAISIFVGGIVAAGLSSLFPIVLLAPWLLADYLNIPRNMKSTSSRLLVLFGICLGLVVPIFGGRPVLVMIVSQALTAIASPLVIGLMIYVLNKKSVMGVHTAGTWTNVVLFVILAFTLFIAISGVIGISNL